MLIALRPAAVQHLSAEGAPKKDINAYLQTVKGNPNHSLTTRRKIADKYAKNPIFFSWDVPRTREGFYHYRAGIPAATKRAIEFAPYADLLWLETDGPSVPKAAGFAAEIRAKHPGKKLVYNLSPSFNWMAHGFSEESLKSFVWDLAKHG